VAHLIIDNLDVILRIKYYIILPKGIYELLKVEQRFRCSWL